MASPSAGSAASGSIDTAHAPVRAPRDAFADLCRKRGDGAYSLVALFVSPSGDLGAIERAAAEAFRDTTVVGCTTAGEISSEGYAEDEIVAVGFRDSHFAVRTALIRGLRSLDASGIAERAVRLRAELAQARPDWPSDFAFLLIDGLSRREEALVAALRIGLGGVPLFGGSAGDGLDFRRTLVLAEGRFHQEAAILTLFRSRCPVKVFKIDHLIPSEVRMVVTAADPERRLVREINAEPAAREYARLVGKDPDQLSPFIFANNPVVVRVGGHHHVRAIQKVEENGDLRFFSAIDEGLVLTLAEAGGIASHLEAALAELSSVRAPEAVIGCDCILRRLEVEQVQGIREMSAILSRSKVIGFSTYGEQFNSVHVNQTLTGVAIYAPEAPERPAVSASLVDPAEPPERRAAKLLKITEALMRRVERATDDSGEAYAHFQRAIVLEEQVRNRTQDLEATLDLLNRSNARLSQAMQEAERARADLFDALEAVREGFALFDADDRLVMCNTRFGMALPDVTARLRPGLRFVDYAKHCARSRHLVLPDGMTPRSWLRRRLMDHRKASVNFNARILDDTWIQVSEQRTPGGGTAIMQTDITELIHLERQERDKLLDEQSRLIRATLDHINQGIVIFDARQRLVGWNARLRDLFTPPIQLLRVGTLFATLAEHFRRALVFEDAAVPERLASWVARADARPPLTLEFRTRDGAHLHVFGQEMPDRGFVISFTDVTPEREAAAALQAANESLEARVTERTLALADALAQAERANASKSRFVAAASHDLLQPLSAAKLFLASLESCDRPASRDETIRRVRSAFDSVESILGALLDISRLDSGNVTVTLSTFPLGNLLGRLGHEFREIARQKGLDFRLVPTSAVVRSDASYLRRILQNLLANAVRYTPQGKVLLGARRVEGGVRIEVWDTGPGIPESARKTIFREFARLEQPHRADGGMGLGLTIVERACALLGHPLELVSETGRGTGFRVTVPRVEGPHPRPVETGLAGDAAGAPTGIVALVIEDDEAVRLAMSTLLEGWGVGVLDVPGRDEALALLEDIGIAPDVILADFHLEGYANGIDAIEAVRSRHGPIPAYLITADRSPSLADFCASAGLPILNKPVEPVRLRALLTGITPGARPRG